MPSIARQVVATGTDATKVATQIVDELAGPDLRLALVFSDWRLDPAAIASITYRGQPVAADSGPAATGCP